MATSNTPQQSLPLIRLALLGGVLLFGAVNWFTLKGAAPMVDPEGAASLRLAGSVLWALATLGACIMFVVMRRPADAEAKRARLVIAWAIGESVALFGGVYWRLTGRNEWYVYGLVFFLGVLMLFRERVDA